MTTPAPLLPRVAQGDEPAVKECLARYGGLVYSLARRFLRDAQDIEDACQDIFVSIWRNAAAFDEARAGEATFVAMIARRRLVDRVRTAGARPTLVVDEEPATSGASIEAHVDAKNAASALSVCSEDQRKVIVLAALHGLTHDEIATELGMPLGTVKSHYSRGIERVKRALSRREEA
jgi:RNA polymerase sigma-70 factor (ECF subfamily)